MNVVTKNEQEKVHSCGGGGWLRNLLSAAAPSEDSLRRVFFYKSAMSRGLGVVADLLFLFSCTRIWRISFAVKIINAIIFIVMALDGVGFTGLFQFLGRVLS